MNKSKFMGTKSLIVILIFFPALASAQYEFRPVIDSTVPCSYYIDYTIDEMPNPLYKYKKKIRGIFYIVEKMPKPESSIVEIENILKKNIRFNEEEKKLTGTLYFQCIVNCKGEAGDYQIIYCPAGFTNICAQAFNFFREYVKNWTPGKQRKKDVDVFVKIQIIINKNNIKVIAPYN